MLTRLSTRGHAVSQVSHPVVDHPQVLRDEERPGLQSCTKYTSRSSLDCPKAPRVWGDVQDETTRKYVQMVKRLVTFAAFWPSKFHPQRP